MWLRPPPPRGWCRKSISMTSPTDPASYSLCCFAFGFSWQNPDKSAFDWLYCAPLLPLTLCKVDIRQTSARDEDRNQRDSSDWLMFQIWEVFIELWYFHSFIYCLLPIMYLWAYKYILFQKSNFSLLIFKSVFYNKHFFASRVVGSQFLWNHPALPGLNRYLPSF